MALQYQTDICMHTARDAFTGKVVGYLRRGSYAALLGAQHQTEVALGFGLRMGVLRALSVTEQSQWYGSLYMR